MLRGLYMSAEITRCFSKAPLLSVHHAYAMLLPSGDIADRPALSSLPSGLVVT